MIETLAPSLHTPTSFASILTGISPENHNVRGFMEELDPEIDTCFDFFENAGFYDGEHSSVRKYIAGAPNREIAELEEPFIYVERMLDTHAPYGKIKHDRDYQTEMSGQEYIKRCRTGEINLEEEYSAGVGSMETHVKSIVSELKERGIMDETLLIITSDHGEAMGERFLGRRRYDHNYPPMREIAVVPTVFYNYDPGVDAARSIDIVPTALELTGRETGMDGCNLAETEPERGINLMHDIKARFETEWVYSDGWRPTLSSSIQIVMNTVLGDLKRDVYRTLGRPLKNSVEDYFDEEDVKDETDIQDIDI